MGAPRAGNPVAIHVPLWRRMGILARRGTVGQECPTYIFSVRHLTSRSTSNPDSRILTAPSPLRPVIGSVNSLKTHLRVWNCVPDRSAPLLLISPDSIVLDRCRLTPLAPKRALEATKVRKNSDFTHRTLASAANPSAQGSTNATALRYHTRLAATGQLTEY